MIGKPMQEIRGGCGHWIRDKDDVAAYRCGDLDNNKKVIFCKGCISQKE